MAKRHSRPHNINYEMEEALEEELQISQDSEVSPYDAENTQTETSFDELFANGEEQQVHDTEKDLYEPEKEAVPALEEPKIMDIQPAIKTEEKPEPAQKEQPENPELNEAFRKVRESELEVIYYQGSMGPTDYQDIAQGRQNDFTRQYLEMQENFLALEKEYDQTHEVSYQEEKKKYELSEHATIFEPEIPDTPEELKTFFEQYAFKPELDVDENTPGFSEDMSAEEIASRAIYAASRSEREVLLDVNGVELEFIKPAQNTEEVKTARVARNTPIEAKDVEGVEDIQIYIDGIKANKSQLINFINANKKEVVNALNDTFPEFNKTVQKDIAAQQRQIQKLEKELIKTVTKTQPKQQKQEIKEEIHDKFQNRPKTATEQAVAESRMAKTQEPTQSRITQSMDVKDQLAAAQTISVRNNIEKALEKYFDEKSYKNDTFYLHNSKGEIEHTIKLSQSKDGAKTIRIDGKNALEGDLKKILEKYPGQMEKQISAVTEQQKGKLR